MSPETIERTSLKICVGWVDFGQEIRSGNSNRGFGVDVVFFCELSYGELGEGEKISVQYVRSTYVHYLHEFRSQICVATTDQTSPRVPEDRKKLTMYGLLYRALIGSQLGGLGVQDCPGGSSLLVHVRRYVCVFPILDMAIKK